ncbi:MAG: Dam family site-specific DNA-(adenine-N6)-methyltransferase [Chloroflexota bacterium]|nr:Dam family site-specific DNA-(adenine-N6)-methyltransferase [Chloroflexota bacterium]
MARPPSARENTTLAVVERERRELAPPLKWAGGKRWLVAILRPLWQQHSHRRLVEPFVGGMAIALGLSPTDAVLNDTNVHLINFYTWLQRGLISNIPMMNDKDFYYQQRTHFNELVANEQGATQEAAELFYYLNRTGYNGLCRFNSKGGFNVPFGRYKAINYTRDFTPYSALLSSWSFTSGDFSRVLVSSGDFIYADPPYDVEFTTYSPGGFSFADQIRLAEWLAKHPGPVVASNQATERILNLYTKLGFQIAMYDAPRMIACNGDRTPAREMLATRGVGAEF